MTGRLFVPGRAPGLTFTFAKTTHWSRTLMDSLCRFRLLTIVIAGLLVGEIGCSRNKSARDVAAMNTSNIQRLANMYAAFQNYKGGRGPNDEAEFKAFIQGYDPTKLSMMNIDTNNVDGVFVSDRDGKPFKIKYKVGGGRGSVDPVIFEQEGKDGTKQVAFTGGRVDSLDDAASQQLWDGKGKSQPATNPSTGPATSGRPTGRPPGAPTGPPGK
jgi:hypothetical protein